MAFSVVREESFGRDLLAAIAYISGTLGNPKAAEALVASIDNIVEILEVTPTIRAVSSKPALKSRMLREHFVGGYVIAYRIDEESKTVKLHRLFHQSQQYDDEWYWTE